MSKDCGSLPRLSLRALMRGCLAATCLSLLGLTGCQTIINPYDARIEPPVPESIAPGRELSKVSLPAYRIEPPE